MNKYLPILITLIIIIAGCSPTPKELTQAEIEQERQAIVNTVKQFNSAVEEENFAKIVPTLAEEVIFFGTDSTEIIKTFADFKSKMMAQWERYDKLEYGDMTNVSIQMDKNATFASIIFGIPVDIYKSDNHVHLFLRVMRTLKKENDKWVIVSGVVGEVRSGDTLKKLNAKKEETEVSGEEAEE